jgi:limonene-1,2-epoxide hydrolase
VSETNEDVLRAVLGACATSIEAAQVAFRQHFTDDCVWKQSGFPTTTGPEEAAGLLDNLSASMNMARIDVEYLHVATGEDIVMTERLDWLVQHDGTRIGPGVVTSVTEFRDGRISAWREYFDTSGFSTGLDS